MDTQLALAKQIRQLRLSSDLTLEQLAEKVNVHWTFLSKIEKGTRKPNVKLIKSLAKVFSLDEQEYQTLIHQLSQDLRKGVNYKMEDENAANQNQKVLNLNVPQSLAVLYSDSAVVNSNAHGIVLSFAQILGNTNTHNVVARVGISLQHAKSLLKALSKEVTNAEKIERQIKDEEKSNKN